MSARRAQRGTTLLEVLIAVALATVALFGGLAITTSLIRGASFSRDATEASVLVQSRLEELVVAKGVTMSAPANGVYSTEIGLDALGATAVPAGPYTRVTTLGTTPDNLARTFSVTVTWGDTSNRPHSVTATRQRDP